MIVNLIQPIIVLLANPGPAGTPGPAQIFNLPRGTWRVSSDGVVGILSGRVYREEQSTILSPFEAIEFKLSEKAQFVAALHSAGDGRLIFLQKWGDDVK
jgi:hypothetical protein